MLQLHVDYLTQLFQENNIEYIPRPYCYTMLGVWGHYTFKLENFKSNVTLHKSGYYSGKPTIYYGGTYYDFDDLCNPNAYRWLINLIMQDKEPKDVQTNRKALGGN